MCLASRLITERIFSVRRREESFLGGSVGSVQCWKGVFACVIQDPVFAEALSACLSFSFSFFLGQCPDKVHIYSLRGWVNSCSVRSDKSIFGLDKGPADSKPLPPPRGYFPLGFQKKVQEKGKSGTDGLTGKECILEVWVVFLRLHPRTILHLRLAALWGTELRVSAPGHSSRG